jgi:hypothetical protein
MAEGTVTGFVNFTRSNPDYLALLTALAAETDPILRAAIEAQIVFTSPLSRDEIELFEYSHFDYIEDNPGYVTANPSLPYVTINYVANGYITDTALAAATPYVLPDYVVNGYINIENDGIGITNESGWTAFVGEYYNDLGETT